MLRTMETLWIAWYVALFDIIGWKVWMVLGIHTIHRVGIRPNIPAMQEYIEPSDKLTFSHSFGVLCVGAILMLQYCGMHIHDKLQSLQKKVSELYLAKMIGRRFINVENTYQRIKQRYCTMVRTMLVTTMFNAMHPTDGVCNGAKSATNDAYNINSVFI